MKMKNLGQKEKSFVGVPETAKTVERFPEITVSSSQLDGLAHAQVGKKCRMEFVAEIIEVRKPSEYDIQRGEGKDEIIARVKLTKGAYQPMNGQSKALDAVKNKVVSTIRGGKY